MAIPARDGACRTTCRVLRGEFNPRRMIILRPKAGEVIQPVRMAAEAAGSTAIVVRPTVDRMADPTAVIQGRRIALAPTGVIAAAHRHTAASVATTAVPVAIMEVPAEDLTVEVIPDAEH